MSTERVVGSANRLEKALRAVRSSIKDRTTRRTSRDRSRSNSRERHNSKHDRREDRWQERRENSREGRAVAGTHEDRRRRRHSPRDSDSEEERGRRHRHSRRRRHDSSGSDSDSSRSSSSNSRRKQRREIEEPIREKKRDRRPHRHDSDEEEEEERSRGRDRRRGRRHRHSSRHKRSHHSRSRSPSGSRSPSTPRSPRRHHYRHPSPLPPAPPPDTQHVTLSATVLDDQPRPAPLNVVSQSTADKHTDAHDSGAVTQSDESIDAPPPLEAPPIERTDPLPPLEAVDQHTADTTAVHYNTPSTHTDSHTSPPSSALAVAANSTNTDITIITAAPAVDLRALINRLAPIPINHPAAAATNPTPSTPAPPTTHSPYMTLDDWRKLSASRPELSMTVLGEAADRKKKARALTGMGGGWKGTEGWKCESLNCIQYENRKYDTVCARCGAVRRFQRA